MLTKPWINKPSLRLVRSARLKLSGVVRSCSASTAAPPTPLSRAVLKRGKMKPAVLCRWPRPTPSRDHSAPRHAATTSRRYKCLPLYTVAETGAGADDPFRCRSRARRSTLRLVVLSAHPRFRAAVRRASRRRTRSRACRRSPSSRPGRPRRGRAHDAADMRPRRIGVNELLNAPRLPRRGQADRARFGQHTHRSPPLRSRGACRRCRHGPSSPGIARAGGGTHLLQRRDVVCQQTFGEQSQQTQRPQPRQWWRL